MSGQKRRLFSLFTNNPIAWLLFILLVIAELGAYQNGNDFKQVCGLVSDDHVQICVDGDCDFPAVEYNKAINQSNPNWRTHLRTTKQRVDDLCARHALDDAAD